MKKLIAILFILLLAACASSPIQNAPAPQEFILKIQSEAPVTVAQDKIVKQMEVPNQEGRLSALSFVSANTAYLKIFSGISVSDVSSIWNDICVLESTTNIRDINLFINSPGGDAFSGLALADQIERARRKGFSITAHASGIVASAAVPVLAVCNHRMAAPGTIFMVHEAAIWKWPGRETASDIRAQNELMGLLRDRYMARLTQNSKLTKDKWEALENKTSWFSSETALEYGLIDKIE